MTFDRPMLEDSIEGSDMLCRLDGNEILLVFDEWTSPTTIVFDVTIQDPEVGDDIITWPFPPTAFFSTFGFNLPVFTNFPVLSKPTMTGAVWVALGQRLRLTFDIDMIEDIIDGSQFFVRFANVKRDLTFQSWGTPQSVIFTQIPAGADMGADVVSFIGTEMPLLSLTDVPVDDFTDFPIT